VKIKKYSSAGDWNVMLPIYILAAYFFVLFPTVNIIFREQRWIAQFAYPAYFLLILIFLVGIKNISLQSLGFSKENLKQNIVIGGASGIVIILSIPVIDGLINLSGLSSSDLFVGAELRVDESLRNNLSPELMVISIFIIPVLEQVFFSGFVLQSLLRKLKPISALYIGAALFTSAHFNFQLGDLILGITTAFFYYKTGTIYAGILFQMSCVAGGILIQYIFPRLTTFLIFLN
jgi:membrane protease YdiL (CAAX protease family)